MVGPSSASPALDTRPALVGGTLVAHRLDAGAPRRCGWADGRPVGAPASTTPGVVAAGADPVARVRWSRPGGAAPAIALDGLGPSDARPGPEATATLSLRTRAIDPDNQHAREPEVAPTAKRGSALARAEDRT